MKRLPRHIAPPLSFILTIQLGFGTLGCAGADIEDTNGSARLMATAASGFDGETLYRGLIFRTGPVAALVPEMWSLLGEQPRPTSAESIKTLRSSADTLLAAGLRARSYGHFWSPKREWRRRAWRLKRWRDRKRGRSGQREWTRQGCYEGPSRSTSSPA